VTTLAGQTLEVVAAPDNRTLVGAATLVQPDVYASNGVLHTVSSLLLPNGTLQLTPEKLLLTYNCSSFVSLLHSVNLTGFVNDTETKRTILAPQDDVMALFAGGDGNGGLPANGTDALRRVLEYHFLPGHWAPGKLRKTPLVETELREPGLNGSRQVVKIESNAKDVNDDAKTVTDISFGGASVVGDRRKCPSFLVPVCQSDFRLSHPQWKSTTR